VRGERVAAASVSGEGEAMLIVVQIERSTTTSPAAGGTSTWSRRAVCCTAGVARVRCLGCGLRVEGVPWARPGQARDLGQPPVAAMAGAVQARAYERA
jgi:hypothetical protein